MPRSLSTLLVVAVLGISVLPVALPATAQEPSTDAAGTVPAEGDTQTVTLVPVPVPDFSQYDPAVADQLRQVQGALDTLMRRATGQTPSSTAELAASFGDVGRHYQAYGLLDSAVAAYSNAALLQPRDPRWPHLLGRAHQDAGHLEEADAAYHQALELAPNDVPAMIYLAEIRVLQGDAEEAQAYYRRALALEPSASAALAGLGEAALAADQPARAVELLEAALESNPGANRLHHPLGLAYRALGDDASARRHLEAAGGVGIRTEDPLVNGLENLKSGERVFLLRGHVAFRAGDFAEAANAYHRAADANPQSVPAQVDLATALSQLGYREGAQEHLRRALSLDPDNGNAHYNLGALLASSGQSNAGELHLRRAAELEPNDPVVITTLADVVAASDPGEALELYRRAQAMTDSGPRPWLGEVRTLAAVGRPGDALERAEIAFEAVPSSVELLGFLARTLATIPDDSKRDGARAVSLAERYLSAGQSLDSGETYALALAEAGRCEDAAEIQAQLVEVATNQGATVLLPAYQAALERYQAGSPCRPPGAPTQDEAPE